jgi:L-ascorbate metabolism protein UlaG (beta-lactamase superfamily)
MEITWLGHSCFRLRSRDATIITDPYEPKVGYKMGRVTGDIVTVSHNHYDHNHIEVVQGEPVEVSGPGEYEIKGVNIMGIAAYHDQEQGKKRGRNTIYVIGMDGLSLCHLGDLGHTLTQAQVQDMGNVDILMIPVGGCFTIDAAQAAEVVSMLEPRIVLPMHYKTDAVDMPIEPVSKFLHELGREEIAPQPKLTVTASSLPADMQVVLLEYPR